MTSCKDDFTVLRSGKKKKKKSSANRGQTLGLCLKINKQIVRDVVNAAIEQNDYRDA